MPNSNFTRRVLLVEDEFLMRSLLEVFLTSHGFEVMGATTALEALKLAKDFDPDAMIVDISLGDGPTGLDLIQAVKNVSPHMAFVVLSNYAVPPVLIKDLLRVAYLQKSNITDSQTLLRALESVLTDQDPKDSFPVRQRNPLSSLTPDQVEVLSWIASGLSNQEIASRRGTKIQSTEQIIRRIYDKLGLKRDSAKSLRVQATGVFASVAGRSVTL
jgi:DNA-binding NarL/FixJ family response regulator